MAIAQDRQPVQAASIQDVYTVLATRPEGLSQTEAENRLGRFGPNAIREARRTPWIIRLASNFTHLMALLLWVGGVVAIIARMPQLAVAIWMVNVINGAFSFWQEFQAEKATEALRRLLPQYARVLRDAEEQRILAEQLVPGDVILLAEGDRISADARVVQQAVLQVDQSTFTGESHPVPKTSEAILLAGLSAAETPNLIFAGTNVAAGTAKAVVFATGMNSQFGRIAELTQTLQEEPSPLQKELRNVTKVVTIVAVGAGLLFFILASALANITLAESFIFSLGMIVAFVPEGLLPTVTLALAMGTQRMAKRHALIKRLSAVETLGSTSVICTDKTGTLTQNEMTVRNLWVAGRNLTVTGVGYAPEGQILDGEKPISKPPSGELRQLLLAGALCNNSRLLPPSEESVRWTILGDPTEAALRVVAIKGGLDLEAEASLTPLVCELPFESRRKRMTTIHVTKSQRQAFVKGAPKEVLALCTSISRDGEVRPLDENQRVQIIAANDNYARGGLRVLAVAKRSLADGLGHHPYSEYQPETVERELTFLGLVAMMDPPRPEVAEAVQKCNGAGIRVIMITGDYGLTAENIARRIGIIHGPQPRLITGTDLDGMSDQMLQDALGAEVIFARVSPEHKLRVVQVLQQLGHVVAVTGDGVNDAPALKKADIGVAMGIAGTDVAKEAADMILTDDNFASIVAAVEEGRAVYANIKKFTTYIFTSNAPEAVPFVLFALSAGRIPLALNVMHVLAIDLGTDMVPALALGAEPPEPGTMEQPPRNLKEHLITAGLLRRAYLWLGPVQGLAAMAAFYFRYWTNGYSGQWINLPAEGTLYRSATAMALAAVVATQIGNLFAQRSERNSILRVGLRGNPLLWLGIASELAIIALIVYFPPLQGFIGTAAFALPNWLFLFAWTPSVVIVDELRKAMLRRREERSRALH